MHRRELLRTGGGGLVVLTVGCVGIDDENGDPGVVGETLRLATTTSAYATGLLDDLNDAFESRYGVSVDTVPQGTGAALETGRRGDADVVMVHARSLEDAFIDDGHGINRRDLMYNDFILVGPPDDPADVADAADVSAAFETLGEVEPAFVSRGDNSGTHQREREIWEETGIDPDGDWYRSIGSGMGGTLNHTNLTAGAYTLSDRATFLSMRSQLDLEIVFQGAGPGTPELLANPYGIIAVNPAVHGNVAYDLAMAYIGYLTSSQGQERIEDYAVDGEQLFFPSALDAEMNPDQYVPSDWTPTAG